MRVARPLLSGACLAVTAGVLLFGLVVLVGIADGGSRLVFILGAGAGVVYGLLEGSAARPADAGARVAPLGALVSGVAALTVGFGTGFGYLEYSVVAGSILAALWLVEGSPLPTGRWAWFRWGGIAAVLVVFVLLPLVIEGGTLGHDESAYALKAREWLEGTPGSSWSPHRGTAMSLYGYAVLAAGGSEAGLRMIGLVSAVGLAVAVWVLAARISSRRVAAIASLAIVASPALLRRSTEYLSDVPSAALLVVCMIVVWGQFGERELPGYRLVLVLLPAWAAFYLRYQSALSFALLAAVILVLWWPKVRARPGPVLATVGLGVLGLVPHGIQAVDQTGTPWGILTLTSDAAGRAYLGEGLVDYFQLAAWNLAAFVGPVVIVAGIIGLIVAWSKPEPRMRYLFLLFPAAVQVVALGVVSHGEERFIFFPLALVVIAGVMAIDAWVESGSKTARAVVPGLIVLLAGSLALSAASARSSVEARAASNQPIEEAAGLVREEAGGEPCAVITSYGPQITFYSGCVTDIFRPTLEPGEAVDRLGGDARFMILVENGKRQPEGEALQGLIDLTSGVPLVVDGDVVDAEVFEFAIGP